ncbi:MAG TPA: hypothetical protein VL593_09980 [Ramlibacter sp.]|jgi:hypothetical protein|nr:hypothetical protein [Ramlibacter sp.]
MKIHQLSINYLAEQDRIFVRVNTAASEEIRLWFTRRLMLGLWPLLSKLLTEHLLKLEAAGSSLESADDGLKKMLADFRKEQFLQQADFDTPYDENQQTLPLGAKPMLVTDVDASPLPSGRIRLTFNERLPNSDEPRNLNLELDPKLMQGMMHLLEQALQRSQWQEPFNASGVMGGTSTEDDDPEGKPKYLN